MAKPRLPRAGKNTREVVLSGGPWSHKPAILPRQSENDPWSLPIRVNGYGLRGEPVVYHGRYNLNTGAWTPLTGENA